MNLRNGFGILKIFTQHIYTLLTDDVEYVDCGKTSYANECPRWW